VVKMRELGVCKTCKYLKRKDMKGDHWVCSKTGIEITGIIPITFCSDYKKKKVRLK